MFTKNKLDASKEKMITEGFQPNFIDYYQKNVLPFINSLETKRISIFTRIIFYGILYLLIILIILLYSLPINLKNHFPYNLINFVIISGYVMCILLFTTIASYTSSVATAIYPKIFSYFGDHFSYVLFDPNNAEKNDVFFYSNLFSDSNLINRKLTYGNRTVHMRDKICGTYKNKDIKIFNIGIRDTHGRSSAIIFKGIVLILKMEHFFNSKTIFTNKPLGSTLLYSDLSEVKLENPLMGKFAIYSNNQVEARCIFTPVFMEKLISLSDKLSDSISASFYEGNMLLMISYSNDLSDNFNDFCETSAGIMQPATFFTDSKMILDYMDNIFYMIDLMTNSLSNQ